MRYTDRYRELKKRLANNDAKYYQLNTPTCSDYEYDCDLKELRELESLHPELITPESPTQKVSGTPSKELGKVKHITPMLSLYTETDFTAKGATDFHERLVNYLSGETDNALAAKSLDFCCELKFDGLALNLIYKDGELYKAATRGDGYEGEDVTGNALALKSIPKKLKSRGTMSVSSYPHLLEIRGEVVMSKLKFNEINNDRLARGKKSYVNARAAAAGSMRLGDAKESAERGLTFYAYSIGEDGGYNHTGQQIKTLKVLRGMDFTVHDSFRLAKTPVDLQIFHAYVQDIRPNLDFDVDGVVYKVNSLVQQQALGYTAREPRWAVAHKFQPEQRTSKVIAIDVQVGRTGKLTPVARIDPILVGGVTVSNVTLHNKDHIDGLGIDIGDTVEVQRAGDVIPEITRVVSKGAAPFGFDFPRHCPVCDTAVIKEDDGVDYRCPNSLGCNAQVINAIIHMVGRNALNIIGIGNKLIETLVNTKVIKNIADLYEVFAKKDTLDIKAYAKLADAVEVSKKSTLARLVYGLGIRHASEGTAKRLCMHYGTLQDIIGASEKELAQIKDIGPVVAKSLYTFFRTKSNLEIIDRLNLLGVTWENTTVKAGDTTLSLSGYGFTITGTSLLVSRSELIAKIESMGGTASSSVNNKTGWLILGEKASNSKVDKANKMGIPVVPIDEAMNVLNNLVLKATKF